MMPTRPTSPAEKAADAAPVAIDAAALERALALCAALLLGAGLIFWIAANWQEQTRQFKYHLLQAAVLAPALAAAWHRARTPCLLLATLALGGLLAFVGQTYQTGADPWQLFAAWAALSLPWAFFGRSDWLWALWVLVAGTALGLWSGGGLAAPLGTLRGGTGPDGFLAAAGWLVLVALPIVLARLGLTGPPGRPRPATASLRLASCMAVCMWSINALWSLFAHTFQSGAAHGASGFYFFNVALIAAAACAAWFTRPRDFVVLAGIVLAVDTVFLGTVSKGLFLSGAGHDAIGTTLLFAIIAAATIGGSSVWLYSAQQRAEQARAAGTAA